MSGGTASRICVTLGGAVLPTRVPGRPRVPVPVPSPEQVSAPEWGVGRVGPENRLVPGVARCGADVQTCCCFIDSFRYAARDVAGGGDSAHSVADSPLIKSSTPGALVHSRQHSLKLRDAASDHGTRIVLAVTSACPPAIYYCVSQRLEML